jgi:hypothetical protein
VRREDRVGRGAGYWSEANARLEDATTELFIATTKDWKQRKALRERNPPRGRIPKGATAKERMERTLLTRRGQAAYRQQGSTIESFGQMATQGLNRFLLRGVEKVKVEWSLWCTQPAQALASICRRRRPRHGRGMGKTTRRRPGGRMRATARPANTIHHGANSVDPP